MQTLSGYKFKYEFVKGALNILPDLLSCNPAMYLVRGNKDPQVTVIPNSLILLASGLSPSQTPAMAPVVTPQLLTIGPAPHWRQLHHLLSPARFFMTFWWPRTPCQMVKLSVKSCLLSLRLIVSIPLRIG
ncbi:hypothetical protein DSO57_1017020 [Entomophthora muscae]|uniref:Uncharacterized protein n=1 Tax=Entomophthora muscae TaxID=34485 RepID=A0ACC2TRL8_9FUNG|nr:hypothetical protein DSO57_1017020 [Entomophthora muscae]